MGIMDETTLAALCDLLEDEIERQQNALEIRLTMAQAIRTRDVAALDAMTRALTLIVRESAEAEKTRLKLAAPLVDKDAPVLSDIMAVASFPWKLRLYEYQQRLEQLFNEIMIVSKENEALLARAIGIVSDALSSLAHCQGGLFPGNYTADGRNGAQGSVANPVIMDNKG